MSTDAFNGPAQIAKIKEAKEKISEGFRLLHSGPAEYYLEGLVEKSEALFKRSKWQAGRRVRLVKTPEINEKDSWGWMGSKHFLVAGATGTISTVDFSHGKFWISVIWDNQTWINSTTKEAKPVDRPSTYCHYEDVLELTGYTAVGANAVTGNKPQPFEADQNNQSEYHPPLVGTAATTTASDVEPELPDGVTYDSTNERYVDRSQGHPHEFTDDFILRVAQIAKHVEWGMRGWDRVKSRHIEPEVTDAMVYAFRDAYKGAPDADALVRKGLVAALAKMKDKP